MLSKLDPYSHIAIETYYVGGITNAKITNPKPVLDIIIRIVVIAVREILRDRR
jgi:hypothetical protein